MQQIHQLLAQGHIALALVEIQIEQMQCTVPQDQRGVADGLFGGGVE
ncbi:hypothetical protein [Aeromonas hydrophila]|nr:hypothetical protein [Aeromonas hydrophila]MCO4224430.1 hypothetical protein [Aeromonas hydrophila]WPC70536.1 hypothetical protein R5M74_18475 [Aeromonas hydrophila]